MATRKPVKMLRQEKWHVLKGHVTGGPIAYKYAVSDHGRIIKFNKHLPDGFLLNLSRQQGFPIWRKILNGEYYAVLIHRLVAKYFLPNQPGNKNLYFILITTKKIIITKIYAGPHRKK